jgi:hypothetical protein
MTPESKRDRARVLRTESLEKAPAMAHTLKELARELEAQADLQERAARLDGPDGTEPSFLPEKSRRGSSHQA